MKSEIEALRDVLDLMAFNHVNYTTLASLKRRLEEQQDKELLYGLKSVVEYVKGMSEEQWEALGRVRHEET